MLLCTRRLCLCKWLDVLKLLLHSEHLYGFSPVWTLMWRSSCPDWLNALSHMWHLYGFSPLWILLCSARWRDVVNRLLQTVHSNGFSPEWLLMCLARRLLLAQHLPHSLHLYLLLWIFMCWFRCFRDEKHFSHSLHEYALSPLCLSPLCLLLCFFKLSFLVYRFWHTVHTYGLGLSSCGCSVISLLSTSVFTSKQLSPVYITTCMLSTLNDLCITQIIAISSSSSSSYHQQHTLCTLSWPVYNCPHGMLNDFNILHR